MFIKPIFYFAGSHNKLIFMGLYTEYRVNLVKARVNVPITLLHIY